MNHLRKAFLVPLISCLLCFSSVPIGHPSSAPQAPISGTLDFCGSLSLSAAGGNYNIDFLPPVGGGNGAFQIGPTSTGSFSPIVGTQTFIQDLNQASQPVGVPILLTNFLTFAAVPTLRFDLTMINAGVFSSFQCGAAPASGQNCTPTGSQYNFTNVTASSSTVSFTVTGNAVDVTSTSSQFVGVITAQFADKSLQSVQAAIASGGSVQTSFSASFAVAAPMAASFSKDAERGLEDANRESLKPQSSPLSIGGNLDLCGSLSLSAAGGNYNIDFLPAGGGNGVSQIGVTSTGSFSLLAGTQTFVKDLNQASQPVGAPILLTNFLTFAALPTLRFDLTMINAGLFASVQCGLAPASGQNCTPTGSQYNFTNVTASSSTVSFTVRGNAVDVTSTSSQFVGVITAQFADKSLQSVLATIAGGGAVQTSFSASFTITCTDTQPPTINCPDNVVTDTDPTRCDAVVNYPPPTVSDDCVLFTQPICTPASGSMFSKGTTTVSCGITDSAGRMATCSFTVMVNDTQAPSITCPGDLTIVTPSGLCTVVNYPPPTVTDNCPGVTFSCNPPSGTCFPLGTTTVTCTATDTSGNTSSCTFTVTTFDICIQDDSNPTTVLLWNSQTGAYRFCCGGQTFVGTGTVRRQGNTFRLEAFPADRRIVAIDDESVHRANGSLQSPPGTTICTIGDRDTRNNTCQCP